jgi:HEAT repeat protein
MREEKMSKRALVGLAVLGWLAAAPLAAQTGSDALIDALKNPSTRTRIDALHSLGDAARAEAVVPMAALLLDGNDDVQFAAIESLLKVYVVRADLAQRPWGVTSIGRTSTLPELAFEAGPLATIPAAVPGEVLVNLCSVMRQDESSRIRFAAAYALGVLASPAMGPMNASAQPMVIADVVSGLTHQDAATRQVIARVAGRVFAPNEGSSAPAAVGDALITAMNDKDALARRWAMDSLGWLKFEHAVQALTDRASYYGKNEEGAGALHAVARIASSGSAPVLRALLANTYIPFRLLSIEGLGRIGDQGSLPAINESATGVNDAGVALAAAYARFMLGQADVVAIADALEHPDIAVQAKVYLAEIAVLKPDAIHALLRTPNPSTRMLAVEVLGASRHVDEIATLEPLLKDPAPEVVEVTSEAIRRLRAYGTVAKP